MWVGVPGVAVDDDVASFLVDVVAHHQIQTLHPGGRHVVEHPFRRLIRGKSNG